MAKTGSIVPQDTIRLQASTAANNCWTESNMGAYSIILQNKAVINHVRINN